MKILNPQNKVIGRVEPMGKPFEYVYIGINNITFPVRANDEAAACANVCKFFGKGYFYLLFVI